MNIGSSEQERERWRPRWDDEEILRGMRRRDGKFGGNGKALSYNHPNREHAQRIRQILAAGQSLMQEAIPDVVLTLTQIAQDPDEPTASRVRACEVLLERVYGKAPQNINLNVDSPFERLMAGLVLQFTGGTQAEVIDITEADDDDIIWDE